MTIPGEGGKADIAKPLRGLGLAFFEIALPYRGNAFRVVQAVQLGLDLWAIHAFQRKAAQGLKTPKHEIELVRDRLKKLVDAVAVNGAKVALQ